MTRLVASAATTVRTNGLGRLAVDDVDAAVVDALASGVLVGGSGVAPPGAVAADDVGGPCSPLSGGVKRLLRGTTPAPGAVTCAVATIVARATTVPS